MQRRQSTRTKPSSRGQTCLAGDQIQPRHENGKMDCGPKDPNLLGTFLATADTMVGNHKKPREAGDWEVWTPKGNEERRHPGHSLGTCALPLARCGRVHPREGRTPPNPPSQQPGHWRLCVSSFVCESSGSKVSSTECIRPGAVTGHVRHC